MVSGEVNESPCPFILLGHRKINLHWLDIPGLFLQNDTIFVVCDFIWCQMTSFDPPSWICHLEFYFLLKIKSQEITKIDTKSSQNAYEMYKLVNCWNLMKKTEKYRIMSKKIDFWPNLHETSGCHGNIKNDGQTIDISKFLVHEGWMNSYWKFQPLRVNHLFKILKKPYCGNGTHPFLPPCSFEG